MPASYSASLGQQASRETEKLLDTLRDRIAEATSGDADLRARGQQGLDAMIEQFRSNLRRPPLGEEAERVDSTVTD